MTCLSGSFLLSSYSNDLLKSDNDYLVVLESFYLHFFANLNLINSDVFMTLWYFNLCMTTT